jgi:AmiR/NasT family two-component response regulator
MSPTSSVNGRSADRALRIVVVDSDPAMCRFYRETMPALGHDVLVAETGRQAVELCRTLMPDLLICDAVPPGLDGPVDAGAVAVLVVSDCPDGDALGSAIDGPVVARLGKPLHPAALETAVLLAAGFADPLRSLRGEVARLRQALEDRKVIERAKEMAARYLGVGQDDAYHRMRHVASRDNRKLIEVARTIIAAGEVFGTLAELDENPPRGRGRGHRPAESARPGLPSPTPTEHAFSPSPLGKDALSPVER